jgi:hypothetical protein
MLTNIQLMLLGEPSEVTQLALGAATEHRERAEVIGELLAFQAARTPRLTSVGKRRDAIGGSHAGSDDIR